MPTSIYNKLDKEAGIKVDYAALDKEAGVANYTALDKEAGAEPARQTIQAWKPSLIDRVKAVLHKPRLPKVYDLPEGRKYITPEPTRAEQPFRTLLKAAPWLAGEAVPFVPGLGEKAAELTGFHPTPTEKRAAKGAKFVGELGVTGAAVGPLVGKIPAAQALKQILSTGLTFATRRGVEEFISKLTTGKPVDWEGIHFEGGIGTLFGAGEVGVAKALKFAKGFKTLPKNKIRPARAEANAALARFRKTGDRTAWDAVYKKYSGISEKAFARMKGVSKAVPSDKVVVKDFGKYPIAKRGAVAAPKIAIPKPPQKPVAAKPAPQKPAAKQPWEMTVEKLKQLRPQYSKVDITEELKRAKGLDPVKVTDILSQADIRIGAKPIGTVGDFVIAPQARRHFSAILDTPVYIDNTIPSRGKTVTRTAKKTDLGIAPKLIVFNPAAIKKELEQKTFEETFYHEAIHALRATKRRLEGKPFDAIPHHERLPEKAAFKGEDYWVKQGEKWAQEAIAKPVPQIIEEVGAVEGKVELKIAGKPELTNIINSLPDEIKKVLDIKSVKQGEFVAERQGEGGRWIRETKQIFIEKGITGDELHETVIHEALHGYTDKVDNPAFMVDFINGYYTRASQETRDEMIEYAKERGKPFWDMHAQEVFTNTLTDYVLGTTAKWDEGLQKTLLPVFDKHIGKLKTRPAEPVAAKPAEKMELYHGTSIANAEKIKQKGFRLGVSGKTKNPIGISLTKRKLTAGLHSLQGKKGGEVLPVIISDDAKIYNINDVPPDILKSGFVTTTEAIFNAKNKGFDGIDLDSLEEKGLIKGGRIGVKEQEVLVWNTNVLNLKETAKPAPAKAGGKPLLGTPQVRKAGGRPLKTLGGMPEKPPGLTKAEVEHLGKRVQRALRAGQARGYPIGYKAGARWEIDKARTKLNEIRMAKAFEEKNQKDAVGIVQSYVPKEKQGVYIKRILAAKTPARIAKLTEAIDSYLDRAERRKVKREFTSFVKDLRKKYSAGEVKFGKLRNDARDRVVEVLEKYDLSKLSEKKRQILEKRDDYIRKVAGSVANAYESLEEDAVDILQMPNARTEELKRLSKSEIGSLDTDQIKYIQASLDHLVKIAERKGSIKERIRAEKVGKLVNQARQEVSSKVKELGIVIEKPGMVNLTRRIGGTAQANIRTLVQMFTGKENAATKELIVDRLYEGHKKKLEKAKEFVLGARDEFAKRNIDKGVTKTLDKFTKITLGGKTFNIDLDNLLSVYMNIRAEGNLRRLLTTSGLDLVTYERDPKFLNTIKRKNTIYTGRVSLKELRNIVELAEEKYPNLKKLAEATFATNNKYQKPAINETSMAFQNFEIARQEKYWPVHRVMPQKIGGAATDISSAIEDQGRYLPRTGGRQRMRIIPWRQEFVASLQSNATFCGFATPMQDIRALVGSSKWQIIMKKSGRANEMNALITMFRRMQGHMTDQSFIDRAGAQLLNRFGKSVLSLRISGYGVQTASIPAAWEIIEPKYFHKLRALGKLPKVPVKAIKEMKDLSPILWMRWTARQFDFITGGVAAQHSFDTLIHESSPLTDKALNQYTWGDQKAIYQIYAAAQEKVAAETSLKRGTAEFKKRAIEITEDALDTQPQWDMLFRSQFTSHPSTWFKPLAMFMSARNAQYNVLLRAIDDYKKGRIGSAEAGKRIGGVIYANVLVAGVKATVKLGVKYGWLLLLLLLGDEEDKEKAVVAAKTEAKKTAKRLPIDAVMNIMSLPVFGSVLQNLTYETVRAFQRKHTAREVQDIRTGYIFADIALDATGVAQNCAKLGQHLLEGSNFKSGPDKDKPKWKRDVKNIADGLAEIIATLRGLPYSAPRGEIYYPAKSVQKQVKKQSRRLDVAERQALRRRLKKAL